VQHALFIPFLSASAATFALLEIQLVGGAGWAANLPTWRVHSRWTRLLLGAQRSPGSIATRRFGIDISRNGH
jgi:hypothetical protein